jgi:glycosyltransferase involved in cell wall biosynthesis
MICVVIPAFNEEGPLRSLLHRLPNRIAGLPVTVIVVSDGSTDHTEECARDCGVDLISLPSNSGKGAALKAGLARAAAMEYSYLVTMDGDGQHDVDDLERLVLPVVADECDVALGSRYLQPSRRGSAPLNRYLVRAVTIAVLKRATGRSFTDPFCGYRCFSRGALQCIRFHGDQYHGELETIFDAHLHQLRVTEVAIKRIYTANSSKMGAHGGTLVGRFRAIAQYLSVIRSKSRELAGGATHHDESGDGGFQSRG